MRFTCPEFISEKQKNREYEAMKQLVNNFANKASDEYIYKLAESSVQTQRRYESLLAAKDKEIVRLMEKIGDLERRIEQSEDQQKKSTGGQIRMIKHYQPLPDGLSVRDTRTGLIWRRAIEPGMFTYKQAVDHAARIAQQTGWPWRLPNREELETLIEKTHTNPAIDRVAFPATPSTWFWSSSLHGGIIIMLGQSISA